MYDYLSFARESASQLNFDGAMGLRGVPSGRDWPDAWRSAGEMGARKAMRRAAREPGSFADAWAADQLAWLSAARSNLRPGARAVLMIGDAERGIDAVRSTEEAAAQAGFELAAAASIRSAAGDGRRRKGSRRDEHCLLFEAI